MRVSRLSAHRGPKFVEPKRAKKNLIFHSARLARRGWPADRASRRGAERGATLSAVLAETGFAQW